MGIQTSEGVVLAVEKRITSPLLEPSSIEKILEVDHHIACCMSGLVADARTMINHARVEAQVCALDAFILVEELRGSCRTTRLPTTSPSLLSLALKRSVIWLFALERIEVETRKRTSWCAPPPSLCPF